MSINHHPFRLWLTVFLCALLAGGLSGAWASEPAGLADDLPVIRVGGMVLAPRPPYSWVDACGLPKGSVPHILKKIFAELGYKTHYETPMAMSGAAFAAMDRKLIEGQVDVILSMFEGANPQYVYSEQPVLTVRNNVIHRASDTWMARSMIDLRGRSGLFPVVKGAEAFIQPMMAKLERQGLSIESVENSEAGILQVAAGKVDYMLSGQYSAINIMRNNALVNALRIDVLEDSSRSLHLAAMPDTPYAKLLADFSQRLAQYQTSGHVQLLEQNYLRHWVSSIKQKNCEPAR